MGVSANLTLRGNVIFNAARAGVNINDGFAGGHLLTQNLIFNTVRETNDHGGINSWDRQPYAWRPWDPNDVSALPMVERENFVINNFNSVWSLCHDDGSNAWVDEDNFLPWSGARTAPLFLLRRPRAPRRDSPPSPPLTRHQKLLGL
jgi:hypothetical protein